MFLGVVWNSGGVSGSLGRSPGSILGLAGGSLVTFWGLRGASWSFLEAVLGYAGALLGPYRLSGALLEPFRADLKPSRAPLRPSMGFLDPFLGSPGNLMRLLGGIPKAFGYVPIAKTEKSKNVEKKKKNSMIFGARASS